MAEILYVKDAPTRGFVQIGLLCGAEKKQLTVAQSDHAELGFPSRGTKLDAAAVEVLVRADERYAVVRAALRILAYADNSERSLLQKLRRKGFSADAAEDAVHEMVRLGYVDESRQLRILIESEVNGHHHGPQRTLARAHAKGYSASVARRVLRTMVDEGAIDFARSLARLLDKKGIDPADEEAVARIKYQYGY